MTQTRGRGIRPQVRRKFVFNRSFGLYQYRPFRIVTNLPSRRLLSVVDGKNVVIADRTNSKTQQWIFNPRKRTIVSHGLRNKCLDVENAGNKGRDANLLVWTCNSGWW
jgi:hypothetical protein